jgi:O-antigen/teichoic acid export membrane protein
MVGILFMAGIVGFQQLLTYFDVLFRSANEFTTVGRLRLYRTVIEMGSAVVLVVLFGFVGRMLAAALALFLLVLYAARRNRQPIFPRIDVPEVGRLVALGLPLMAVDVIYGFLISVDRILILEHLDRTALGYYGVGLMAVRFLYILPRVVWETMYPRFGERYGEAGSPAALEQLLLTPLSALAILMAVLLGAVVIALPMGVAVALPDYLEGLGAARILVCGSFFLGLLAGPGNFIHTISKRQAPLILAYGMGLGLAIVLIRDALLLGYGIAGVALATLVSFATVATVVLMYVFSFFFTPKQAVVRLLRLYSPFVAVIGVVMVSEYGYPTPTVFGAEALGLVAAKLVCYGAVAAAVLLVARRHWVPFLPFALSRTTRGVAGGSDEPNNNGDTR